MSHGPNIKSENLLQPTQIFTYSSDHHTSKNYFLLITCYWTILGSTFASHCNYFMKILSQIAKPSLKVLWDTKGNFNRKFCLILEPLQKDIIQ